MFTFWQAQIGVSLGAGVITAMVSTIRQQASWDVALWSIGVVVIGYLVMLGIFFICAVMCAPVTLDRHRAEEIQNKEVALKLAHEQLSRKYPADEHQERFVRDALNNFSPGAIRLMKWLLNVGEIPFDLLDKSKLPREHIDEALMWGRRTTLLAERELGGTGWRYNHVRINDELKNAVKDVLHPPPRPVTPPLA